MKTTYTNLSELPIEIRETGNTPFTMYPQAKAIELLEKMQDSEWWRAHCDNSKSIIENIKHKLTVLSDGRILFDDPHYIHPDNIPF